MKSKFLDAILLVVLLVTVVSAFANTWEGTNVGISYGAISVSADGRIICAVNSGDMVEMSTNSGKSWFIGPFTHPIGGIAPNGVAISADGTKIHAVVLANSTWLSTNQGLTWAQTGFPFAAAWRIACSADGTKVIASSWNGPLCFSTNSGENCYTSSIPNAHWASLASSADGLRMVTAMDGGDIYFSTDYGASWTPAGFSAHAWLSACVSGNGKWVGATTGTNSYISSDAGINWITNNWGGGSIACSAEGSRWIIAGGPIRTSADGGISWETNLPTVSSGMGTISADGCEMCVLAGNVIWMGRAIPSPQLDIKSQDSNLALSWLLPSTNFVLQQNSDPGTTNWITISNSPTLNFTNLHQELAVLVITNNAFFRLMAQ